MKQYTFYEYSFNPHNNPMSPLDCKEIQSVLSKEISPEYALGGLIVKLQVQYFG